MSYSYSRGLSWPVLLFVIVLVLILGGMAYKVIFTRFGPHYLARTMNNAGMVSACLIEFKRQKLSYPDQRTREMLLEEGITDLSEGDDANAYLSQVLAARIIDNEKFFLYLQPGRLSIWR